MVTTSLSYAEYGIITLWMMKATRSNHDPPIGEDILEDRVVEKPE